MAPCFSFWYNNSDAPSVLAIYVTIDVPLPPLELST